jgi:hypothetical protein
MMVWPFRRRGQGRKRDAATRSTGETIDLSRVVRVKVSDRAEVFCNGRLLEMDDFDRTLAEVRDAGGVVIYYRESPSKEPTPEQMDAFGHIPASRVSVILGDQAPPEWGRLEWFEMDECPFQFRLGIVPNQPVLYIDTASAEGAYVLRRDQAGDAIQLLLDHLTLLISAHRLVETKPTAPERAFSPQVDINSTNCVQLRFAFDSDVQWASFYEPNALPENVQSFYEECRRFARQLIATGGGRPLSPEEALRLFSPDENL